MRPAGTSQSSFTPTAVGLRVGVLREIEFLDELFGQRSARALGENDDLCLQVIAGLEIRLLVSFFVDALIVGADSGHTVAIEEQFGAGESSENRNAGLFDFAAKPLHKPVQRDDVVAMVAQEGRRDGELEFRFFGEESRPLLSRPRRRAELLSRSPGSSSRMARGSSSAPTGSAVRPRVPSRVRRYFLC